MAKQGNETAGQWHARALADFQLASRRVDVLGRRPVTIRDAIAGHVFGPEDADMLAARRALDDTRDDLLAATTEIQRTNRGGFWPTHR